MLEVLLVILYFQFLGVKNRRFQATWLQEFRWMRYSISLDAVFCAQCCLFNPPDSREKAFLQNDMITFRIIEAVL